MFYRIIISFSLLFLQGIKFDVYAQLVKKHYVAKKINNAPQIDGYLSEDVWNIATLDTIFYQYTPFNKAKPTEISQFRILYDNNALYIGAFLYDNRSDSIVAGLGKRDDGLELNADQFLVDIGPYDDGVNSFTFMVSSSGVQTDIKNYYETQDKSWDAVWKSKTRITPMGWVVEMKIPYSAIHLANRPMQVWSLNILRVLKRREEIDSWNFINRDIKGVINQSGKLIGLTNIKPPFRLSLIPFITSHFKYSQEEKKWKNSIKGGLNLEYGINQSFTLDATLYPDYSQLESDDKVLNLTAFETKFEEKRPFFNEGIELFSKSNIYYPRRIGYEPENCFSFSDNIRENAQTSDSPLHANLFNAVKISGRTSRKLGLGVLNAVTLPFHTTVFDTVTCKQQDIEKQNYKNYNVIAIDKSLPNNSFFSIVNTNMVHYQRNYLANVTGAEFKFSNFQNSYSVSGKAAFSQIYSNDSISQFGFKSNFYFDKTSGSFQFRLGNEIISKDYNQNDMGYLPFSNEISNFVDIKYNVFKPFWEVYSLKNSFTIKYSTLFQTQLFTDFKLNFNSNFIFRNQLKLNIHTFWRPKGNHDYYDAREQGRVFKKSESYFSDIRIQTDSRKIFSLGLSYKHWGSTSTLNLFMNSFRINPRVRIKKRTQLGFELYYYKFTNSIGYVNTIADTIFMGKRNISTISPSVNWLYTFTNKAWLNLKLRHYRSTVNYDLFYSLLNTGKLDVANYSLPANIDYHNISFDLIFHWEFAPGSQISVVWKNKLENSNNYISVDYFNKLSSIINETHNNYVSLKLLYYFDFSYLKNQYNEVMAKVL